jgi:hypothetical protein
MQSDRKFTFQKGDRIIVSFGILSDSQLEETFFFWQAMSNIVFTFFCNPQTFILNKMEEYKR